MCIIHIEINNVYNTHRNCYSGSFCEWPCISSSPRRCPPTSPPASWSWSSATRRPARGTPEVCPSSRYFMTLCAGSVLYCTVLYCAVLCCAVLYCTVLYCTTIFEDLSKLALSRSVCDMVITRLDSSKGRRGFQFQHWRLCSIWKVCSCE